MKFEVLNIGLTPYREALELQHRLLGERLEGQRPNTLIITEHPKVFTLGRTGSLSNILAPAEKLQAEGIEIVEVERGGDVTYHGPGQLVAYPIFLLPKGHRDLREFLRLLEQSVIATAWHFGAKCCTIEGLTGVWAGPEVEAFENKSAWQGEKKLTSMGLAFRRWVSFHGLALNVTADLNPFNYMNLCGLVGKKPINLCDLTKQPVSLETVAPVLIEEIAKRVAPWEEV